MLVYSFLSSGCCLWVVNRAKQESASQLAGQLQAPSAVFVRCEALSNSIAPMFGHLTSLSAHSSLRMLYTTAAAIVARH